MSTQNYYFCLYHWLSTYPNVPVHISWLAAATFDLFLRCVWCIILLEKGKHCGVFRGEGCNARDTYLFPLSWVFVCKLLQPNLVLWWTTMSQNVMSIFKVKVTVWAYIIKIWEFLLYLLLVPNQWVFCNQTQFECRSSSAKKCPMKMLDCCVQDQCHSQG